VDPPIRKVSPSIYFNQFISYSSSLQPLISHLTSQSTTCLESSCTSSQSTNTDSSNTPSTGATGYIGGDALYALTQSFHSAKITALVRSESKASLITSRYPSVTPVIGDLDSAASITKEAAEADVVLSA
jgi:hypothetical protein